MAHRHGQFCSIQSSQSVSVCCFERSSVTCGIQQVYSRHSSVVIVFSEETISFSKYFATKDAVARPRQLVVGNRNGAAINKGTLFILTGNGFACVCFGESRNATFADTADALRVVDAGYILGSRESVVA